MSKIYNRSLKIGGDKRTINSVDITVLLYDKDNNVLFATGTTKPTDASSGYAKGALFIDTDVATGSKALYENQGTTTSSSFNLVGAIGDAELALSDGGAIDDNNGNELLQFEVTASAVNHVGVKNAATGNSPIILAKGEADTGLIFQSEDDEEMLILDAVAGAVNEITIASAATGVFPKIKATGEADTGINFENSEGEEILILDAIASAVNQVTIKNAATGNPAIFSQDGEDDIGFEFHAKNGEEILKLEATAAATTFISIKSLSTGVNPQISAEGEADLGITLMNDQAEELAIFACVPTAVNEVTFANAAAGSGPEIRATGGDTDVSIELVPKGAGNIKAITGAFEENVETVTTGSPTLLSYGATQIDSTGGAVTGTLGSGSFVGQLKTIVMTEASTSSTISITNHETSDPEVATFDAVDEYWLGIWTGTEWATVSNTCTFV